MNFNFLSKKEDFWAWSLLIYGFLARILYIFCFTSPNDYLWSDAGTYDAHAMRMASGTHIELSTYWPPFFHIFLSLIYRILIWLGLEAQRVSVDIVVFGLFYAIGFWCIYQISKKLFSPKIALIILAVVTFWWPFVFLNALVMSENLFFPTFLLGFYFLIKNPEKLSTGMWVGLFWGIAAITRPIILAFIPCFLLWCLWQKINWKFIAGFILAAGLVIANMCIFNFYYTGGRENFVSSSGGFNFAMTWCDVKSVKYFTSDGYWYWFASAANVDYPDERAISTSTPFENQEYYYQIGLDCIKERPFQIVKNSYSIVKLFHSHLFPTTADMPFWEPLRIIFKILTAALFVASAATIIGIATKKIHAERHNRKFFYLFALAIFSLFATIYLQNVGEERYMIPYVPLLILMSIPSLSLLYKKFRAVKKTEFDRRIWIFCLTFAIFSFFIFWLHLFSIKETRFILQDGTETKITLPDRSDNDAQRNLNYKIIVDSKIKQVSQISIAMDDFISKISVNGEDIDLSGVKKKYSTNVLDNWRRGYIFNIPLKAGQNTIIVSGQNTGWGYSFRFAQRPSFTVWMLVFLAIGIPTAYVLTMFIRAIYEKNID